MWRAAGCLSSLIAIGFFVWCQIQYYETAEMLHGPLRAGTAGAFCLLAGICCFVAARMLGVLAGIPEGARAAAWKTFTYASIPLGALIIGVERLRSLNVHPLTANMRAVYIAGAFVLMAGLVGLVGERVVAHARRSVGGPVAGKSGSYGGVRAGIGRKNQEARLSGLFFVGEARLVTSGKMPALGMEV